MREPVLFQFLAQKIYNYDANLQLTTKSSALLSPRGALFLLTSGQSTL